MYEELAKNADAPCPSLFSCAHNSNLHYCSYGRTPKNGSVMGRGYALEQPPHLILDLVGLESATV